MQDEALSAAVEGAICYIGNRAKKTHAIDYPLSHVLPAGKEGLQHKSHPSSVDAGSIKVQLTDIMGLYMGP